MNLPKRWHPLLDYLSVLMAPLVDAGADTWFLTEAGGPDGGRWNSRRIGRTRLDSPEAHLAVVRSVARLCGARQGRPSPGSDGQAGHGVYYVPASFVAPKRTDLHVHALGAILIDIDDRDHGGRGGTLGALARLPQPTAIITSGGGVQAAFVLHEAVVFERANQETLEQTAREYLVAALALQAIADADATAWPARVPAHHGSLALLPFSPSP